MQWWELATDACNLFWYSIGNILQFIILLCHLVYTISERPATRLFDERFQKQNNHWIQPVKLSEIWVLIGQPKQWDSRDKRYSQWETSFANNWLIPASRTAFTVSITHLLPRGRGEETVAGTGNRTQIRIFEHHLIILYAELRMQKILSC